MCYLRSNLQFVSIGSGNGLAPNRRQANTQTNDDPMPWRICASPGNDWRNVSGDDHTFVQSWLSLHYLYRV